MKLATPPLPASPTQPTNIKGKDGVIRQANAIITAPYKVGDGDHTTYVPRVGSCHKHILSYGNLT